MGWARKWAVLGACPPSLPHGARDLCGLCVEVRSQSGVGEDSPRDGLTFQSLFRTLVGPDRQCGLIGECSLPHLCPVVVQSPNSTLRRMGSRLSLAPTMSNRSSVNGVPQWAAEHQRSQHHQEPLAAKHQKLTPPPPPPPVGSPRWVGGCV